MTPGQRLAIGFAIGGIITLLIHPGSRALMLYTFKPANIESVLHARGLSAEPVSLRTRILHEGRPDPDEIARMSEHEMFATANTIARILNRKSGELRKIDFDTALVFFKASEERDPDNAYWPQLAAALEAKWGSMEAAEEDWRRAATRVRWRTDAPAQVDAIWNSLAAEESVRLAWQGLHALSFRRNDPALFIAFSARRMTDDLESRYYTVVNSGLIIAGATSLETGRLGVGMLLHAAFLDAPSGIRSDLREMERLQVHFIEQIAEHVGQEEAARARLELLRAEGWQRLIATDEEISGERASAHISAVLTATTPSALFGSSIVMTMVAMLGLVLSGAFGSQPHPDPRLFYAAGIAVGIAVHLLTGILLLALWCVALGVVLGMPGRISKLDPLKPDPVHSLIVALLAIFGLAFMALYFGVGAPPARFLGTMSDAPRVYDTQWASLAFVVISLAIPIAVLRARTHNRSSVLTVGETLASLGAVGAFIGVLSTVITAPVALWEDARNRATINRWIANEPAAFEAIES